MLDTDNYYKIELEKHKPSKLKQVNYIRVKIDTENGDTKWLNVNIDSVDTLIEYFQECKKSLLANQ